MNTGQRNSGKKYLADLIVFVLVVILTSTSSAFVPSNSQSSAQTKPSDCNPSTQENAQPLPEWRGSELHEAISREDLKTVRTLLKQNANPNEKDNYGNTPLFYAVGLTIKEPFIKPPERERLERQKESQFKISAVEELLKHGADPNQRGSKGLTPLIEAAAGGYGPRHTVQILSLLISHKADVNLRDKQGFTALMAAAYAGSPEAVKFLLEHGADPKLTDCEGKTAIKLAESFNHTEVVRILQSAK
jgi:uncharacterized protein